MNVLAQVVCRFREDESGAAMVEYTVLLGIITVAVILTIMAVGGWVSGRWNGLCGNLNTAGGASASCNAGAGTGS